MYNTLTFSLLFICIFEILTFHLALVLCISNVTNLFSSKFDLFVSIYKQRTFE